MNKLWKGFRDFFTVWRESIGDCDLGMEDVGTFLAIILCLVVSFGIPHVIIYLLP